MKLRIRDDSIRFRLTQSEVRRLAESGRVESMTRFPGGGILVYAIAVGDGGDAVRANYGAGRIEITLDRATVRRWAESDHVSIERSLPLDGNAALRVLVEKDFKCAIARDGEDDSDAFPNPSSTC